MLIALAARAAAAPATAASIAEAVRYADILTGADPDAEVARRAPDDPDDQRAGTSSDDEDGDRPGSFGDATGGRGVLEDDDDDDDDDANDAEASVDGWPTDRTNVRRFGSDATNEDDAEAPADGGLAGRADASDRGRDATNGDGAEARAGGWLADRAASDDLRDELARSDGREDQPDGDGRDADVDGEAGSDEGGAALAEHAGELALLDDEPAGAAEVTSDEAGFIAPAAGAVERYEARMRRRRSWILGRLDVGLAWRRRASEPMHAMAYVSNEVWLLATWRR